VSANHIFTQIGKDLFRHAGSQESSEGIRKREGVAFLLESGQGAGERFPGANVGTDEPPELLKRIMEGNRNELDFVVWRGIVAWGEGFTRNGQLLERPVRTVVAKFGLEMRGGAIDRKIPFPGARVNLDLMNPSLTGDIDLEVNFSLRGFLFGVSQLMPGEVPISKEAAGVACGEKKTACSVRFGKFA